MTEQMTGTKRRMTAGQRFKAGAILAGFLAIPATGGVVGQRIASAQEHASNKRDAQQARGFEECLAFTTSMYHAGKVTLKASQIPPQTQRDCRLDSAITTASSLINDAVKNASYGLPLNSKIALSFDPDITLPKPNVIKTAIEDDEQNSKTTGIGSQILESGTGFTMSFMAEITAMAAFSIYIDRRNRLNNPGDPSGHGPQSGQAMSEVTHHAEAA